MPRPIFTPKPIRNRRLATILFKLDWGTRDVLEWAFAKALRVPPGAMWFLASRHPITGRYHSRAGGVWNRLDRALDWSIHLIDIDLYHELAGEPLEDRP